MNKREYKIKRNMPCEGILIKLYTDAKYDVFRPQVLMNDQF